MEIKQNKAYKLPLSKLEIIDLYTKGQSCYKLAKTCNCSPQSIFSILKKSNTPRRSLSQAAFQYSHNRNYFNKIDTESKAYFLGLLYADGSVFKNRLSISLQEIDKHILETFKEFICYTGPLTLNKKSGNRVNQWQLAITSLTIVSDLFTHGVFSNKGFKLTFPRSVPDLLLHHFIRGYFDGDGCIYSNPKNQDYLFSMISTFSFLEDIQTIMIKNLELNKTKLYNPKNCKDNQLHILTYQGGRSIRKIREWLYKDATIYLTRKREKFFSI